MIETLFLLIAGLLGGAVNSLAGGGSFIVFPALLFVGVPPVLANASNTYAALPGYVSGAFGYWTDLIKHRDRLLIYAAISLIFGYLGAELLLSVSGLGLYLMNAGNRFAVAELVAGTIFVAAVAFLALHLAGLWENHVLRWRTDLRN